MKTTGKIHCYIKIFVIFQKGDYLLILLILSRLYYLRKKWMIIFSTKLSNLTLYLKRRKQRIIKLKVKKKSIKLKKELLKVHIFSALLKTQLKIDLAMLIKLLLIWSDLTVINLYDIYYCRKKFWNWEFHSAMCIDNQSLINKVVYKTFQIYKTHATILLLWILWMECINIKFTSNFLAQSYMTRMFDWKQFQLSGRCKMHYI